MDFQGAAALAGRQRCDPDLVGATVGGSTVENKLGDKKLVVEEINGVDISVAKKSRQRAEKRFSGQSGHSGEGGVVKNDCSDKEATEDDGEEDVGFGLVVLSASVDGTISAWEMLGKSEKYRMRHPAGVEVTSMLVLPGGSVLVTGEFKVVAWALWPLKNPQLIPSAYFQNNEHFVFSNGVNLAYRSKASQHLGHAQSFSGLHSKYSIFVGLFPSFLGTDDGSVRFWRLDTGAGESFKAHKNTVSALAAYRDRQGSITLASADFEGSITIWRARAKDGLKQTTVR